MSIPKSDHKVYIFTNDYNAICHEVYEHRHIETGGNLFGLLTTSGSAVIHVVLGLGQGCRRTDSFHQDKAYMHRVERFVKEGHMLCNIGEWYSHPHRPSLGHGDEQTIQCNNFPKGMSKFLVITANMNNRDQVVLSPYFFTHGESRCQEAAYVVLESDNPFSMDVKILAEIALGAEGKECQRNETNHGGASLTGRVNPRNTGSNFQGNDDTSPTYSQAVSRGSHEKPRSSNSTHSPEDRATPPADHTSLQASNNPSQGSTLENQTANSENEKATTKDVILKEIYDDLKNFFVSEGEVEIERGSHGEIQMTFTHETRYWMLCFPEAFPNQPAKLYRAFRRDDLSTCSPCHHYYLEKPLTNHVNIFLSIKKCCLLFCKTCENISKETLTKPVPATVPPVNKKLADAVNMLEDEIKMTLATPLQFTSEAQSDGSYTIEFEHHCTKWSIELPNQFPDKPAGVYKHERRYDSTQKNKIEVPRSSNTRQKQKPLVSSDLIVLAISGNCDCSVCWNNCSQTIS